MPKFITICLAAALLSGCASSSVEDFDSVVVSNSVEQTKATADAAFGTTKVASLGPVALTPSNSEASAGGVKTTPAITSSLQSSVGAITAIGKPGNAGYKIGPQDVIEVSVFKVPELSKVVQVSETGTVNLPLVGEIGAAGKTAREVEFELTKLLGAKYLQKPQVTIFIKEYNSQRITVEGAVKRPGVFPMQGRMSLLQAVAMAQGLEDVADNTVLVFRETNGKRKAARFDVSDIRTGDAEDPQLMAGDIVVAGSSTLMQGFNGLMKALPITGLFAFL